MHYKLYRINYKNEIPQNTGFDDFRKFYEENGVKVVGGWENVEKKNELYFMTGYRDQEHYKSFVTSMKENSRYKELTEKLNEERESVDVTTLSSMEDISSI